MMFILFSGILALLIYLILLKSSRYWEERGVPYIKPVPIFGNMFSTIFKIRSLTDLFNDIYNAYPNERYVDSHITIKVN